MTVGVHEGKSHWKQYPAYKPSGVEWLGDVPEGWNTARLKFFCKINPSKSEVAQLPDDLDVTFLPMECIGEDHTLRLDINKPLSEVWEGYTYFKDSDVVLAKITPCFENGKCSVCAGLTNKIGFGTTELHVLRATDSIIPKFCYYIIQNHAFKTIGAELMFGTTGQKRLPEDFVKDYKQGIPPLLEQYAIAAFLDREIPRIDALIEKKERQIELLQEKRAALISHAVTRGLDPSVPMKESGVEWLGVVPEGWEVKKIKWLSNKIGSGKTPRGGAEVYQESGILFIRSQNVHFDGLKMDDIAFISPEIDAELATSRVLASDLLLNITGASLGRCTIVPGSFRKANVNQHVCIIRPIPEKILPDYLNRSLSSSICQWQIFRSEEGVSREGLNFSQIGNIVVITPPIPVQKKISEILDVLNDRINTLIKKIEQSLDKLREYRSALISAVVTGKIDVRQEAMT